LKGHIRFAFRDANAVGVSLRGKAARAGERKGGKPPQQNQTRPLLPAPLPLLIHGGTLKFRDSLPRYASLAPYNSELQSLTIIPKFLIFWGFFSEFSRARLVDLASRGVHIFF